MTYRHESIEPPATQRDPAGFLGIDCGAAPRRTMSQFASSAHYEAAMQTDREKFLETALRGPLLEIPTAEAQALVAEWLDLGPSGPTARDIMTSKNLDEGDLRHLVEFVLMEKSRDKINASAPATRKAGEIADYRNDAKARPVGQEQVTNPVGGTPQPLVERLRTRARIRRAIPRAEPDRISTDLEAAADRIDSLERQLAVARRWYDDEYPAQDGRDQVYPWDHA